MVESLKKKTKAELVHLLECAMRDLIEETMSSVQFCPDCGKGAR